MGQDSTKTIVPLGSESADAARKQQRDSRRKPTRIVPMSEVHCPAGHVMKVPAEFAADGRTFYCRECGEVFTPGARTVSFAVSEIAVGMPKGKLRLPRWKDIKKKFARSKKAAGKPEQKRYDAAAHAELARAFPNIAAKIKPLLASDVEVECPEGHSLIVPRELVEAGKEFFCPVCRKAFRPGGGEEEPAAVAAPAPTPEPVSKAAFANETSPAREGLAQIATGCGLLARASWRRLQRLRRLFSGSGGWVVSCVVHAGLLALAALLGFAIQAPKPEKHVRLITEITPEDKQRLFDEHKKRDIFRKVAEKQISEANVEQKIERPRVVPEPRVTAEVEALRELDEPKISEPAPSLDMPSAAPAEIFSIPSPQKTIAVPAPPNSTGFGGGLPQTSGPFVPGVRGGLGSGIYALRDGAKTRLKAAKRFGGGEDTESAVELALAWLAKNQKADGSWDFQSKQRVAWIGSGSEKYNLAATGLATLAFLGAGYSHKHGKHKEVVGKALDWLIYNQKKYGGWAKKPEQQEMHSQGIATLAMIEGYSAHRSGKDGAKLLKHAQLGVNFIQRAQYPYSGWSYYMPRHTRMHWSKMVEQSVVIWNGMALKGARTSGVRVDGNSLVGMVKWLDDAQGKNGQYAYSGVCKADGGTVCGQKRSTPCMVSAALMMRLWTGTRPGDGSTRDSANIVLKHLQGQYPRWKKEPQDPGPKPERPGPRPRDRLQLEEWNRKYAVWMKWRRAKFAVRTPDMYFLHHGTIAMFQIGGKRWEKWNGMMKEVVLKHQQKDGCWKAGGTYLMGSDVMSTAFGALILESYYRYSPLYTRDAPR